MKKFFLMLTILFVCGIVSADVCIGIINESSVLLDMEVYRGYANAKLIYREVFWNILYERLKLFAFILLLYFTPLNHFLGVLLASIFSYIWGFFIMSCITELGLAGIVVGFFSVLPHGLLYVALIIMLLGRESVYIYHSSGRIALSIANVIIMILLLLTGCVLESIVSTHFIPWVIRLSLI